MNDIPLLKSYLQKIGLTPHATRIYIALVQHGEQSITDIAQHSGLERTKVYRTLPELENSGLVRINSQSERSSIAAMPFDTVQILLSNKEQELDDLRRATPRVARALRELSSAAPRTNVKVYRGAEGIKQMLWNQTKASGELLSILRHGIQLDTRQKFFERWVSACNANEIAARSIVGADFNAGLDTWRTHREVERLKNWQGRSVPPEIFTIEHDMIIYDNTVGYFYWGSDEIFGIEITNQLVAKTQRQFFELLWNIAENVTQ